MSLIEINCYHTCSNRGGPSQVQAKAPFLSGKSARQWLTQGYYFWTDSEHFAHWWGKAGYNNKYAIVMCKLIIDDDLFLDLVGSVACQLFFVDQMRSYQERLRRVGKDAEKVTVNDFLTHLKSPNCSAGFPFIAIKAQDIQTDDTLPLKGRYPYRKEAEKKEFMPALTRQQICLFESGYECLVETTTIYPNSFKVKVPQLKGYKLGVTS